MIDHLLSINGLKNEDVHLFKSELQLHKLKKKENFISINQRCRYLALIEEGFLRTYHLDKDGKEVTTDFHQPNTFCSSYYSFYAQQPSFEFIEAITDCDLYLLSYNSLQKLYAVSCFMNVFGRSVLEKTCVERDFRLKKIMHLSARAKYEWFLEKYSEVYKVAKLGHIASFLGITLYLFRTML